MTFFAPEANPALKPLPKCNLHTHLEGSIRPETVWDLAQRQGIELGVPREAVRSAVEVTGDEQSNELTLLQQRFEFSRSELYHIQTMSIEAGFLPDTQRRQLVRRQIDEGWQKSNGI